MNQEKKAENDKQKENTEKKEYNTQELVDRFIALANEMRHEGNDISVISAAFMTSCSIYATYASAGNTGYLMPSGVDKVTEVFKAYLIRTQLIKKSQYNPDGKDEPQPPSQS